MGRLLKFEDLKHGMRVTCKIEGEYIDDARISAATISTDVFYICQNVKEGLYADDMLGYKYSWVVEKGVQIGASVTDLRLKPPFEEGDIIVDRSGDTAKVLAASGYAFLRSTWANHNKALNGWFTYEEAETFGWKLQEAEPEKDDNVELTLEEVADKLGIDVDKLRIKD